MVYNDKRSNTIKLLPFFANYGRHANLFLDLRRGLDTKKALVLISDIKHLHKEIQGEIQRRNESTETTANKKRKNGPQLKKGDKVYLLIKNLKSIRLSKKLDYIKVGLFLVI